MRDRGERERNKEMRDKWKTDEGQIGNREKILMRDRLKTEEKQMRDKRERQRSEKTERWKSIQIKSR